jgi:hypothetical protein
VVLFGKRVLQQLHRQLQKTRRVGKCRESLQRICKCHLNQEKYLKIRYPDLHLNRANVEAHLEEYDRAIKDLLIADGLDPTLGAKALSDKIRNRMEFTKTAFERAVLFV